jgi:hypothetical protein
METVLGARMSKALVDLGHESARFLAMWIGAAAVSLILIGIETIVRARRIHSFLPMQMVHAAVEQFLPAIVAASC